MVKWKYCVLMAVLLLLPSRAGSKTEDDDDDERNDEDDDTEDNDEDGEDDDPGGDIQLQAPPVRRTPAPLITTRTIVLTRTSKKLPLECYVCAYKPESPLRACLDPTRFRVHTMTCHSADDKCFTAVTTKGNTFDAVVRGCRSACVGTPEITCCEYNRCNHQAFATPTATARLVQQSKATKPLHPTVLFFVTVLLVLQTVVKVSFV
ncbi:nucleolar complex protein 2 homolog [Bicyclus anynana]|uniref:Nucleolar complex protein 2 homolog n=1 Tax=Bicyclus anynana TaxID=110368 RepID=A0A6J1NT07_BICAN|nr:nucleolar complex protein 2 homolog [Bicyclus anynana]